MSTQQQYDDDVTLFLCGDVMTGRGIDQILPHPSAPQLFEPCVSSAREYVEFAEQVHGPVRHPVDFAYVWGDVLPRLAQMRPAVRIVNLETAVTTSDDAWPQKGIHYRMHPRNIPCLTAARIDGCTLANNHSMDWGRTGLEQSLAALHAAGIRTAGAGMNDAEAAAPARFGLPAGGSVLLFACGTTDSGVAAAWEATGQRSGVWLLRDFSSRTLEGIAARVHSRKEPGDIVVLSIHWGGNWGYEVAEEHCRFAQQLIHSAGIDIVHGHSSHHPKGIEVFEGKLILYGCGDFLNDYEGIHGYASYRGDLGLMYLPTVAANTGRLARLQMIPTQVRHLRVNPAPHDDARWLCAMLSREGQQFGTKVELLPDDSLVLGWNKQS